ncbi:MAG: glycosyltransferase family 2 protein [Phycisphaerales bacterium JB052]
MHLSFIIPTRNRAAQLRETLRRLGELDAQLGDLAELIILDNASDCPEPLPKMLQNGIAVTSVRLDRNLNTAARNIGAEQARGTWLIMLDDDSNPLDANFAAVLRHVESNVGAVGGEIMLPSGARESGGLPEVIVGCGCAIRRDAFLQVGGYDESFGYYAEEYDLCAKLIAAGSRITHMRSLRFEHRKSTHGRDFNEIIYRLVRNNAWVMQRYAPRDRRGRLIDETIERYRVIAEREDAQTGFQGGLESLRDTLDEQPEMSLTSEQWERFEGRSAVRATVEAKLPTDRGCVRLVGPAHSKGRVIIEEELIASGCTINDTPDAHAMVASLSPGPMLDILDAHPGAMVPWDLEDFPPPDHPART